ncbi:hypothetical protein FQN60_006493 [Etheostoma spectabile]|uniref:Uncharacterized protein n=1 Tax=Etheostoma spectabile TaxID=54343 RepID=A0A5J5CLR9_9PERO|nr:hypothetical protein FQN60_006493 [Etheostoma spectabile]
MHLVCLAPRRFPPQARGEYCEDSVVYSTSDTVNRTTTQPSREEWRMYRVQSSAQHFKHDDTSELCWYSHVCLWRIWLT